jgi:hypothetical protein
MSSSVVLLQISEGQTASVPTPHGRIRLFLTIPSVNQQATVLMDHQCLTRKVPAFVKVGHVIDPLIEATRSPPPDTDISDSGPAG